MEHTHINSVESFLPAVLATFQPMRRSDGTPSLAFDNALTKVRAVSSKHPELSSAVVVGPFAIAAGVEAWQRSGQTVALAKKALRALKAMAAYPVPSMVREAAQSVSDSIAQVQQLESALVLAKSELAKNEVSFNSLTSGASRKKTVTRPRAGEQVRKRAKIVPHPEGAPIPQPPMSAEETLAVSQIMAKYLSKNAPQAAVRDYVASERFALKVSPAVQSWLTDHLLRN